MEFYDFYTGQDFDSYRFLGAHPSDSGVTFCTFAPAAQHVSIIGDFNGWTDTGMGKIYDGNFWECTIPNAAPGMRYKYRIYKKDGSFLDHADPYAFYSEVRPGTASVICGLSDYHFHDEKWNRSRSASYNKPINIYELHFGSWKKKTDAPDGWYSYQELAALLIPYLKENGYNYLEIMPLAEHPCDESWGYQETGFFSPTSRYGTPDGLKAFISQCHQNGIGVILDWVPAHFPKDAHGLADFDGQPLFEYADPRKGEHPDWGTKVFDYSKYEVDNFLIANAIYWVEKYHVDGLRVDAVASMLYLDYGRLEGQWVPNKDGGNQNLEAIEFFKHLNTVVQGRNHGALVIAEESTAWPKVTSHPEQDGLGFTFKWNMGWMHDFLEYMKLDPYFRKYNHHKMTFGLTYFTSEKYILVLSHDEVVHLKCSMINKMPGLLEDKFANLKAGYTFMLGHPGKKLLFMGQDFGQFHEWDEKAALDWYLTDEPQNAGLQSYVKDLLQLYRKYPALYELDYDWDGFQWINANDGDRSIFSFVRYSRDHKRSLLFVINFTPVERPDYRVGVPKRGTYTLVLDNSHGLYKRGDKAPAFRSVKKECDGQDYSIAFSLPAYGTAVFRF